MIKGDKLTERGPARDLRKAINRLQDQVNSLRIGQGVGYLVKHTALGQILKIIGTEETTGIKKIQVERFKVKTIHDRYLTCIQASSDVSFTTPEYQVVKPRETWHDEISEWPYLEGPGTLTFDSVTSQYNRRKLKGVYEGEKFYIDQTLMPSYTSYDVELDPERSVIYGLKLPNTGPYIAGSTASLDWIDLNVAARHWACIDWKYLEVCVNNQVKHIYALASTVGEPDN